ncbi:signal recognition particle subunit SRP68-like [Uloborus diversus]|uniref:signal recognition particle subunit SRP68-like n=1 Tax=Uloborus diversus TaxID=327109 RepID=UPI002409BAB9|nr:signal recognition particle subunit SRP68-like [Uloborus diversus]
MAAEDGVDLKNEEGANVSNSKELDIHQKTFTLEILHIIKDAQQQHGLRHGDYQRYRSYCSRKLRRIRKSLHFILASKHRYQAKKITEEVLTDVRFLYIPLMMAERAWGYAMQLKQEANTETRKKFHLVSRLRKATKIASDLETLCESSKCDARTKLEAQAYSAWIKGSLYFELQQWQSAIECFRISQTIYEKLSEALNEDEVVLYKQRVEELIPNIRYCAYNIGDETAINDLMKMRLSGKTSGEDLLASDLDHLIAQTREKQAVTLSEVEWQGRKIPVRHEKIRLFLLNVQDAQVQVEQALDLQAKIEVYERLLLDCKDALQVVRDEMKDQAGKGRSDAAQSSLAFLQSYLTYIRLSKTIERNLLFIESLKQNMGSTSETAIEGKRVTKPQDLVRPYEIIIQNLHEMKQLPGVESDSNFLDEAEASILAYKAHRCFYIAEVYAAANKWVEAIALYGRSEEYSKSALKNPALKNKKLIGLLKELLTKIEGNKYNAYSLSILGNEDSVQPTDSATKGKKNLMDRLNEYREDATLVSPQPRIAQFPPDFKPIPCKPLFFDLALNQIEFPPLDDKIEQKKGGGITGFVRGWLGGWK